MQYRNEVPRIPYLFTAVPSDLLPRLKKAFEEPQAWWSSQISKYLLRLKPEYQKIINDTMDRIGFKNPIVGLHIRRGNKITEAAYQPIEKYMDYADEYFDILEFTEKVDKRRVYIATDEPEVVREAMRKYPNYNILSNHELITAEAQKYENTNFSSLPIIIQSRLLAKCDYFVFTMSSNLGRKFYEFFLWDHSDDGKDRSKSLDWRHFEDFEGHQYFNVVMSHNSTNKNEVTVKAGDIIETYRYDMNGFMTVIKNRKTIGLIPSFKLDRIPNTAEFAKYDDIS